MTTDVFSPQRPEDEHGAGARRDTSEGTELEALQGSEHELERVRYQQPIVFSTYAVAESHRFLLTHFSEISRPTTSASSDYSRPGGSILSFVYRAAQLPDERPSLHLTSELRHRAADWGGSTVFFLNEPMSSDDLGIIREAGSALESKEVRPEFQDDE